jgi:carboxymethylenebutenolidase
MNRRLFAFGAALAPAFPASAATRDSSQSFESGGKKITVEWYPPEGLAAGEKAPGVLLLHGAEGLMLASGYRAAARRMAASGIGVAFVHYFERTGETTASLDRMRRSFPPWSQAIRDGLTWLGERPDIDRERLGIVGISLGASLALYVASHGETRIKAIVDFFGPVSAGVLPKDPKLPPTLILHGANDQIVPLVHARTLEAWLKRAGTPYEMKVYPAQGHGFVGVAQTDATRRAAAFLAKHLGGRPPD